jgi:hypothetical protein
LGWDEEVDIPESEDRRGLDIDSVIVSNHASVDVASRVEGNENWPKVVPSIAGTKGDDSFASEEDPSLDVDATITIRDGEKTRKGRTGTESCKEANKPRFTLE